MRNKLLFFLLLGVFMTGLSSATTYQLNSSLSGLVSASVLRVTQLRYDPYPVNAGEYFDLWVQAQWIGSGSPGDAVFELLPQYPFSLDSNENATRSFGQIGNQPVVMNFKVRVDKDAVEGINELDLRYNSNGYDSINTWATSQFDIQVANAQTDFDLVVQESSGTSTSIAVANVGKNTANSLIVRIPDQEGYRTSGTNGQMVGNLASGDYSIVSFSLQSALNGRNGNFTRGSGNNAGLNASSRNLKIEMDYTDGIGDRRSVIKEVRFDPTTFSSNSTRTGTFTRTTTVQSTSIFSKLWFWVIILLIIAGAFFFYKKYPEKVDNLISNFKGMKSSQKNSKSSPDWVQAERKKK